MMGRRSTICGFHFPRAVLAGSILLCIALAVLLYEMVHVTPADHQEYLRLMTAANPLGEKNDSTYSATQQRDVIRKDYFFSGGADRLQLRLLSDKASLLMEHTSDRSNLVEKMRNVKCHMQEELFYQLPDGRQAVRLPDGTIAAKSSKSDSPQLTMEEINQAKPMQLIRYFESDEASYHYKSDQFYANNVQIMRYIVSGHQLPQNDLLPGTSMRGTAETIEFNLTGDKLNFKATGFKAQFRNIGGNF